MNVMQIPCTQWPKRLRLIAVFGLIVGLAVSAPISSAETGDSANIIRATPYFAGGQQRGYRLYPKSGTEAFDAIGLRAGDLILEVDGKPMTEPRAILDLFFDRLDSGESITAKIRRDDDVIEVPLQIL